MGLKLHAGGALGRDLPIMTILHSAVTSHFELLYAPAGQELSGQVVAVDSTRGRGDGDARVDNARLACDRSSAPLLHISPAKQAAHDREVRELNRQLEEAGRKIEEAGRKIDGLKVANQKAKDTVAAAKAETERLKQELRAARDALRRAEQVRAAGQPQQSSSQAKPASVKGDRRRPLRADRRRRLTRQRRAPTTPSPAGMCGSRRHRLARRDRRQRPEATDAAATVVSVHGAQRAGNRSEGVPGD